MKFANFAKAGANSPPYHKGVRSKQTVNLTSYKEVETMVEDFQKGYVAMALDMAGFNPTDIELVIRSLEFVTKNVTKEDAQDFYKKKGYIHDMK